MWDPLNEDKDTIQLKKEKLELEAEIEALKKEVYRLQLENDVKKGRRTPKKIRVSVFKNLQIEIRP